MSPQDYGNPFLSYRNLTVSTESYHTESHRRGTVKGTDLVGRDGGIGGVDGCRGDTRGGGPSTVPVSSRSYSPEAPQVRPATYNWKRGDKHSRKSYRLYRKKTDRNHSLRYGPFSPPCLIYRNIDFFFPFFNYN